LIFVEPALSTGLGCTDPAFAARRRQTIIWLGVLRVAVLALVLLNLRDEG
jgi:hypothetical protein